MSGLDYNHSLFIQEFLSMLESEGYFIKKNFDDSNKGERFYKTGYKSKSKAFGRYKYIPSHLSNSGYPMIMWTVFESKDKAGKVLATTQTNYFWFKPEVDEKDKKKLAIDQKKRALEYKRIQKQREEEELARQKEWRNLAYLEYQNLKDYEVSVDKHPYLLKKRIQASRGLIIANQNMKIGSYYNQTKTNEVDKTYYYIEKGDLIIPAINIDNEFVTYQKIDANGKKRQRVDVSTIGAFYIFGRKLSSQTRKIYLCEGYATGYSLHMSIGENVLVCFDVNNVGVIAEALLQQYPSIELVFCTDNDRKKSTKVGLFKGFEYAYRFNQPFAFPKFENTIENESRSDWNDLAEIVTPETMREMLLAQEKYFKVVGKDRAIRAACAAYGVSMDELAQYSKEQQNKCPDLFKSVLMAA